MNTNISLVMIVKNEEANIERCLYSVSQLVNEIVIIDTGSTDRTKEIAVRYGAVIYDYPWCDDFSAARNYALDQATNPWSLVLDADEYISWMNIDEIYKFISGNPAIGRVKLIDQFDDTDGIAHETVYISRLFPTSCRYKGRIHEQIDSHYPRLVIDLEIQHDGYVGTYKSKRNVPLLKKSIEEYPWDPYYYFQLAKEYRGMKEIEQWFLSSKQAFKLLSGKEGFAPSALVNFIYSIISSGRLTEGIDIIEAEPSYIRNYPDYYFVAALYLLELMLSDPTKYNHLLPYIEQYYKKALEIGETGQEGSVVGTGSFAAHFNLGVFYETTGNVMKARDEYLKAAAYHYEPATQRLQEFR